MFDPERMLGQMLGGALGGAFGGSRKRRGGGLLGRGNTAMKAQLGIGLLGVAFAAYEHFQQQRGGFAGGAAPAGAPPASGPAAMPPPPPPPAASAMPPPPPGARAMPPPPSPAAHTAAPQSLATGSSPPIFVGGASSTSASDAIVIMQAMIAAAAADGRIDDAERARILERAARGGVDAEGMRFLEVELATPKTLDAIANLAHAAIAADVYAASLLAISLDTDAERAYLERLAQALSLDASQRTEIHARLAAI